MRKQGVVISSHTFPCLHGQLFAKLKRWSLFISFCVLCVSAFPNGNIASIICVMLSSFAVPWYQCFPGLPFPHRSWHFRLWHGWYRPRRSGCPRPCMDTRKKIRTFWPFRFSMRSQEIPKSNVQYFHCFSIIEPRTWWSSHLQQIISHEYLEVKAIWRSIMICPNPAVWIDSTCVWTHEIQGCLWVKRLWLMIHSLMTWSFPNTYIYTEYIS